MIKKKYPTLTSLTQFIVQHLAVVKSEKTQDLIPATYSVIYDGVLFTTKYSTLNSTLYQLMVQY